MSDEAIVNEEVENEESKTAVPDPADIKAAIAAKNASTDVDDDNEESEGKVNPMGFLIHCVIVVICTHGYLQYITYASPGMNWFLSGANLLLPIINLWSVCCGLIYYWEIHWALALIITATCLLSLVPKATGYISATICIALFIICASHTFPERKSEAQMERELNNDLGMLSEYVTSLPMRVGKNAGVKEGIERMRDIRVRALRLGYRHLPSSLDLVLREKK